jgi:hypothetical protein
VSAAGGEAQHSRWANTLQCLRRGSLWSGERGCKTHVQVEMSAEAMVWVVAQQQSYEACQLS